MQHAGETAGRNEMPMPAGSSALTPLPTLAQIERALRHPGWHRHYRYPNEQFMDLVGFPVLHPDDRIRRPEQDIWQALKDAVHKESQSTCFYCGTDCADFPICDHFIPLARGGTNASTNLVTACDACNTMKGILMPQEFYRMMGWWQPVDVVGA